MKPRQFWSKQTTTGSPLKLLNWTEEATANKYGIFFFFLACSEQHCVMPPVTVLDRPGHNDAVDKNVWSMSFVLSSARS